MLTGGSSYSYTALNQTFYLNISLVYAPFLKIIFYKTKGSLIS